MAKVEIEGEVVGEISGGLLIFLGVGLEDGIKDADYLASKIAHLRIFSDDDEKMNQSVLEKGGQILVVSQFTLWGDCRKGRRPSFVRAAEPAIANELYIKFISILQDKGIQVAQGRFQEMMDVHIVNDGPVTILLDSEKKF